MRMPEIEIVAIHGLGGNRLKTFTSGDDLWLRDFLPENPLVAAMNLRVSTFGYDASVAFGNSVSRINDFARQLLNELHRTRRDSKTTGVPIVIIAHSLGGIIAKETLIMAHDLEKDYGDIKQSVKGVIFMGTPHLGAGIASASRFLRDIANVITVRGIRRDLLKALEPKSQELTDISRRFVHRTLSLQILSMYEQNRTKNILVVDQISATLGIPNERLFAIPRDHSGICKYSRHDNSVYATVSGAVVELLEDIHQSSSLQECLRSLYFQSYQTRRLNISERDPCTFEWIWKHPGFEKWERSTLSSFLWLQGKPASGKSTLMKYICTDLNNRLPDPGTSNISRRIVIDFFYSDRGGDAQRGHESMLRSLLYQLLSKCHDVWKCYRPAFEEFKQRAPQHWQLESLKQTFSTVKMSCYLPLTIYVLIDAMDESDELRREEILNLLSSVCDSEGSLVLKILVASRPVPRIASVFKKYITITLEEETIADIIHFTSKRMEKIGEILSANTTKVRDIHHIIVERSRGVFLWVKLVLDELEDMAHDGCTPSEIQVTLEHLPQDLDKLYAFMLQKLEKHRRFKVGMAGHGALRMVQWVAYAGRPLRLLELIEAVATAVSDPLDITMDLLEERRAPTLDQAKRILWTRCGGFLEVKNGSVQFIHQTVREFLLNQPGTLFYTTEHESMQSIATTCFRYLKFIHNGIARKREGLNHAGSETEDLNNHSLELEFLKSSRPALLNYAAYAPQPLNISNPSQRDDPVFENLKSARRELIPLIRRLFQRAIQLDCTKDIDLLLQNGAQIDQEDTDSIRSFLKSKSMYHSCFFACEGYSYILDWLVKAGRCSAGKALQHASAEGHKAGVQCLIEYGVSDKDVFQTLDTVIMNNQWDMVELLLQHKFEENDMYKASYNALRNSEFAGSSDMIVRTLHHAAALKGYTAMVQLCLDNGEDIGLKDSDGRIALHFAAEGGHETTVRQLLQCGADKEAKTSSGSAALHLAAAGGYDSTVRVLILEFEANKKAVTSDGSTALHLAAGGGHDSTVQVLIQEFGDDKEAKTNSGSAALHLAAASGYDSTVRVLIQEFEANREAVTSIGSTALHLAAAGGHDSTVQVLIEEFGADKEAKTKSGSTALHRAAACGQISTVRVLIQEFGADKKAKTSSGQTALLILVKILYDSEFIDYSNQDDTCLT